MSYQALARKWRPRNFSELVGQPHIVNALSHQLTTNTLHHAYLFTGTRGVGKTTIARLLAKSLNCTTNGISSNPCCECENCRDLDAGKFIDLIEVDAASRTGVDDTRDLIESVSYLPAKGSHKVYLIDEVHMFSKSSFNALLKTLEEPPPYVKFVLATTDPDKLPVTILSRCLQFNLKRYSEQAVFEHLKHICTQEGIVFEPTALHALAKAGDGSMRDTLSLTDQALAFGQGALRIKEVTMLLGTVHPSDIDQIIFSLLTRDAERLFVSLQKMTEFEVDCEQLLVSVLTRIRQLSWLAEGVSESDTLNTTMAHETAHEKMQSWLNALSRDYRQALLQLWYDIGQKSLSAMPRNHDQFGLLEMTLLRMLAFTPTDAIDQAAKNTLLSSAPDDTDNLIDTRNDSSDAQDVGKEHGTKHTQATAELNAKRDNELDNAQVSTFEAQDNSTTIDSEVSAQSEQENAPPIIAPQSVVPQSEGTGEAKLADEPSGTHNDIHHNTISQQSVVEDTHIKETIVEDTEISDVATINDTPPTDSTTLDVADAGLVDAETKFVESNGIDIPVAPEVTSQALSQASELNETIDSAHTPESQTTTTNAQEEPPTDLLPTSEQNLSPSRANDIHLVEWATLVKSLGLGAYEQAVAEAGELTWQSPQHAVFKHARDADVDAIQATLQRSLSAFAQHDISVDMHVSEETELENAPAQAHQAQVTAKKQAITEAFFQHPVVTDIMTNLNAKVAADDITILEDFSD